MTGEPENSINGSEKCLAMLVRRWFLIFAVPVILLVTIISALQWQRAWRWFLD